MRARLIYNGGLVILLGLLAGFPYAMVITGGMEGSERAWRMAHLEGLLNGMLAILAAGVWDSLVLSARQRSWLALSLIFAGYANVIASIVGAFFGVRGLALALPFTNVIVWALFVAAIVAVFLGLGLLIRGGAQAIRSAAD
jgi:hypothetical protein